MANPAIKDQRTMSLDEHKKLVAKALNDERLAIVACIRSTPWLGCEEIAQMILQWRVRELANAYET